jgi:hypothetical protein
MMPSESEICRDKNRWIDQSQCYEIDGIASEGLALSWQTTTDKYKGRAQYQ